MSFYIKIFLRDIATRCSVWPLGLDLSLDKPAIKNILGRLSGLECYNTTNPPSSGWLSWLFLKGKRICELYFDFFPPSSLSWSWASFTLKSIPHLPQLFSVWQRGANHIRKGYMSWTPGLTGHHTELLGPINGRQFWRWTDQRKKPEYPHPHPVPKQRIHPHPPNLKLSVLLSLWLQLLADDPSPMVTPWPSSASQFKEAVTAAISHLPSYFTILCFTFYPC